MIKIYVFDCSSKMIIDDREHDLIDRLKAEKVEFTIERLPLGDIKIENEGHMVLIERKRTDDFAASISDGRWREQKARLAASGAIAIYIIEGSLYGQNTPPKTLVSALVNTMLRDKMFVIQTRGLEDTSLYLQQLAKKVGREIQGHTGMKSLMSKRKRKVDNAWQLILMAVPNVSERIAAVLIASYPTLTSLQEQLRHNSDQLRHINVTSKRKIGKKTIDNLKQYLI